MHQDNLPPQRPMIAVGVLISNSRGEIFLARSLTKWHGRWIIPGGHLEYGESLQDCVKRETREELGIEITDIEFIQIQEAPPPLDEYYKPEKHFIFINFAARMEEDHAQITLQNSELQEFCFKDPQEALSKLQINSPTRRLIEKIVGTKSQ
ncbi:MAG: NUDIX domain-containing protein [Anaerolineales bacterium]|nr:NUDIX domain-containing protein [Anaerolineales bacterium]